MESSDVLRRQSELRLYAIDLCVVQKANPPYNDLTCYVQFRKMS